MLAKIQRTYLEVLDDSLEQILSPLYQNHDN